MRPNYFFPTPNSVANLLLDSLEVYPSETILEPSAGQGHLAERIRARWSTNPLVVVEQYLPFARILKGKGFHGHITDFLKYNQPADVIIANPPFCNNFQDSDHFRHAWSLLSPGGRMAFIMQELTVFPRPDFGYKPKTFARWLDLIGARKERMGSLFINASVPTGTGIAFVYAEKHGQDTKTWKDQQIYRAAEKSAVVTNGRGT